MTRRSSQPAMLPYREDGIVKYARAPEALHDTPLTMDDDFEPLIGNAVSFGEDEDPDLQRFTATGKPLPVFKQSVYVSMGMYTAPQFLPQRYTDDSVIPVVIQIADPLAETQPRRRSLMDKIKGIKAEGITKVVFMPRRDYLKYFAKDYDGSYIGTEPQRDWTEADLEDMFGMYKKDLKSKRGQRGQTMTLGLNA